MIMEHLLLTSRKCDFLYIQTSHYVATDLFMTEEGKTDIPLFLTFITDML